MKRRRTKLTRSLSTSRSSTTAKADRKRTASEIIRSDMVERVTVGMGKRMGGEEDQPSIVAMNTSSAAARTTDGTAARGTAVDSVRTANAAFRRTSEDLETEALATLLVLDKAKGLECLKVMRGYMATCWWFVQPLLFCLIGADIPVEKLRADTIGELLTFYHLNSIPHLHHTHATHAARTRLQLTLDHVSPLSQQNMRE